MDRPLLSCRCLEGDPPCTQFERTFLGTDDLYAEVSVDHCTTCGRDWLHYLLEFEFHTGSGRWYRGLIGPEIAFSHRNAASVFGQLPEYWAGGSRFEGRVHLRSGPLDVSP
ncbi:MAG TPA: hypothetical protein VE981_08495 [Planctomycetota bacterium]|nr:hypothetical protein [Planctomycetota bacterium]